MENKFPFKAVIFDLDGVITKTAKVHSSAWKIVFDDYLEKKSEELNQEFNEFTDEDYLKYVDGKSRYEGVKSFLESRGIYLDYGKASDSIILETYCAIGNRKNFTFNELIKNDGVEVYKSTVELIKILIEKNIKIGIASSSKNCKKVLSAVGLKKYAETIVDGNTTAKLKLNGKPEPDIFLKAAENLQVNIDETVIVEDASSGVLAGKKGNFGLVIGLARNNNKKELKTAGADIVLNDISEMGFEGILNWFNTGLAEDNWSISFFDYNKQSEKTRESLLCLGNGYMGSRAAMEETQIGEFNYPATYMAGVFNKLKSNIENKSIENEDLVNIANWISVKFKIDDDEIEINKCKIIDIERKLDFRTGLLSKKMVIEDSKNRITKIHSRRFVSMANQHIAAINYSITPKNYQAKITVISSLHGNHKNAGVERYNQLNQQHLSFVSSHAENNLMRLSMKTTQSEINLHQTAILNLKHNNRTLKTNFRSNFPQNSVELEFDHNLSENESLNIEKIVYIQKNSDLENAKIELSKDKNFNTYFTESAHIWEDIWREIDIEIQGDRMAQKLIRLHLYHLLSTTSPNNLHIDFGIPARGLSGEAYRGHIFWDEIFILPFYNIHFPDIAKSVLLYRFRRLNQAKQLAKENGYSGAIFPWQSGSSGKEESQKYHFNPISKKWDKDLSSLQRHISLAIAFNIIQYYKITEDKNFMLNYGAEMLIEICRFWADAAEFNQETSKYSIPNIMGPDEFHEKYPNSKNAGLKDNAYTNIMTSWVLTETLDYLNNLSFELKNNLKAKLDFKDCELKNWAEISRNLNLIISEDGIISQFDGYFDLNELDWDYYKNKYGNIHRIDRILKAEGKSPDKFKVSKQADLLMLFYNLTTDELNKTISNLGYNLPKDYAERNFEYYIKRTSHGSTLSKMVHAKVANQIGFKNLAWDLFSEALQSDYKDVQGGTTAEGIHIGVMAGSIMMVINTFAGLSFSNSLISINPDLPEHWRNIKFKIKFKNQNFDFEFKKSEIKIRCDKNTFICLKGKMHELKANINNKLKF
jgi:beta-phosphoglucomutase family hydrolase